MTYKILTQITISAYTIVEANDKETALDRAFERFIMPTPANMGGDENSEWVVKDFDCEIDETKLEAEEV